MGALNTAPPRSLVGPETIAALVQAALATPAGCFVEVGVYQGGTAWHLAAAAESQCRPIYLYDTFCGIPYKGRIDSHEAGDFKDTSSETVRQCLPYARVIEGIFPHSAVPMEPVAFVHLDCDQYQAYLESLEYLEPRMVKGGMIWCDDVPCLAGAAQAVSEFARTHHRVPVLFGETGKTVIRF